MATVRVKFVADAELKHRDGVVEFSAKAGEILDLPPDQAQRWMKRNAAILYTKTDVNEELEAELAKEAVGTTVDPLAAAGSVENKVENLGQNGDDTK